MDWTTEKIAELERLWNQTDPVLTTREIGKRMGISPNAVVGKAHRLLLVGRPSPIKRGPAFRPPHYLDSVPRARPVKAPRPAAPPPPVSIPVVGSSQPAHPERIKLYAALGTEPRQCQWPIGDPKAPDFRFCVESRVIGKPFCPAHCAIGFESAKPVNVAATEFFSKLHKQSNAFYGAQETAPLKARGAA